MNHCAETEKCQSATRDVLWHATRPSECARRIESRPEDSRYRQESPAHPLFPGGRGLQPAAGPSELPGAFPRRSAASIRACAARSRRSASRIALMAIQKRNRTPAEGTSGDQERRHHASGYAGPCPADGGGGLRAAGRKVVSDARGPFTGEQFEHGVLDRALRPRCVVRARPRRCREGPARWSGRHGRGRRPWGRRRRPSRRSACSPDRC